MKSTNPVVISYLFQEAMATIKTTTRYLYIRYVENQVKINNTKLAKRFTLATQPLPFQNPWASLFEKLPRSLMFFITLRLGNPERGMLRRTCLWRRAKREERLWPSLEWFHPKLSEWWMLPLMSVTNTYASISADWKGEARSTSAWALLSQPVSGTSRRDALDFRAKASAFDSAAQQRCILDISSNIPHSQILSWLALGWCSESLLTPKQSWCGIYNVCDSRRLSYAQLLHGLLAPSVSALWPLGTRCLSHGVQT